eukprot:snap_masked-scaffold364_size194629-processed-gene-0.15 protein:Tk12399 transcript:snap_masked-scaffold364_size194629-processed-gene-0.15-mRNA-1 annotation:"hypothetical protein DAPPUDRAFT_128869"
MFGMSATSQRHGLVHVQNYVYGEFVDTEDSIKSFNPATGAVWAKIPDSHEGDVHRAVYSAKSAFDHWASIGYAKRGQYLMKVAKLIEKRLEEFAKAESRDQGKPVGLAKTMDIPRAILNLRSFAESWTHILNSSNSLNEIGTINYSTRSPLGVAGLIAPWNLPLYLLTFKLAPALMAGNTVVCKPSEMTSVTAFLLAQVFHEAGVPRGVFNLICGYGHSAGEAIVRHPDVRIISFTGSTGVGSKIAAIAAPMMKKVSLELGGKNAAILFQDANLDKAIPTLIKAAFLNQGEICLCTSRIFVHTSLYETFVDKFVRATKRITVGDPEDPSSFMGALNSEVHLKKVQTYIEYAKEDGGQILCGETVTTLSLPIEVQGGYFCQPTVITQLADDSRCMQDEIFGPVVCITFFSEEDEVVARANNVRYGLCASVWSENLGTIHRVAAKLEVGTVWANCWLVRSLDMPFGGCKDSGTGREGTHHSMEAFTQEKTVCLKIN